MAEDINNRVKQYVALRDMVREIDEKWEAEKKKYTSRMEEVSGRIQRFMSENKITDSLKTEEGTCYISTRYSASVQDGEAFMKFVQQGNFDMIERRANATAVKDYVKNNNQLPPGVNLSSIQSLGVRRPGKAKTD